MKILGTGLSGLVGTRCTELLRVDFEFTNLSLETGIDITNEIALTQAFTASDAPWVLHMAAFTDVDKAEMDKSNGQSGVAWKINVLATQNLVNLCRKFNKHLLYISTDYVFDGSLSSYDEDDSPNPMGWYGVTKYEGEKKVSTLNNLGLIIRIANPYRDAWEGKSDFVHKIADRLKSGQKVNSPSDQLFVPTHIDDIAAAIKYLIKSQANGIYHVVGSEALSPYSAASIIAQSYGYNQTLINKTTFKDFFANRAPRPFQAHLINAKITNCGIHMKSFSEGMQKIVKLERSN
jgi:dTDP-4-dehydrorhamnose reductase